MSECLKTECKTPRKYRCPVNGKEYGSVGVKTILHHLIAPWQKELSSERYYYCTDKHCDVVYFGQDDSVIPKSELRTKVGLKDEGSNRTVCYCFGVSYSAAKANTVALDFVKEKTKSSLCSCETSNPSGRCCLKDFPKQ